MLGLRTKNAWIAKQMLARLPKQMLGFGTKILGWRKNIYLAAD